MNPSKFMFAAALVCLFAVGCATATGDETKPAELVPNVEPTTTSTSEAQASADGPTPTAAVDVPPVASPVASPAASPAAEQTQIPAPASPPKGIVGKLKGFIRPKGSSEPKEPKPRGGLMSKLMGKKHQDEPKRQKRAIEGELSAPRKGRGHMDSAKLIFEKLKLKVKSPNEAKKLAHDTLEQETGKTISTGLQPMQPVSLQSR